MTNIPEIRFAGFYDTWEQRKLEDCSEILTGGTPSTSHPEYWEPKEVPWLSSGEVHKKHIRFTDNMISKIGFENSSARWIPENSVVIALAGQGKTRGTVAINEIALTTNQSIAAIVLNQEELNTDFVYSNLDGRYEELRAFSSGDGTRGGLNKKLVGDVIVPWTILKEQQRIGELFRKLDDTITLHQDKVDLLREVKSSLLTLMFPSTGMKAPLLRFEGFTDDWEQRKLDQVVSFYSGLTYKPDDVQGNGTLVLRSSNVKNDSIVDADNVYVPNEIATSEQVRVGDIIVVVRNGSRDLIGKHAQIKEEMPNTVIGAFMTGIRSEHPGFVNSLLSTSDFQDEVNKNMGSTINQITGYMFANIKFAFPKSEEQQQIGQFFQKLDETITLHQDKADLLKNIKQTLLSKMFPNGKEA